MHNRDTMPIWLELPAEIDAEARARPTYAIVSDEVLVYRQDKVYACFRDKTAVADLVQHSDVRELSASEVEQLVALYEPILHAHRFVEDSMADAVRPGPVGLGEVISRVASRVGLAECAGCRQRRRLLNRIVVWGWWRTERAQRRGNRQGLRRNSQVSRLDG